jgi:hypothetical protein
MKTTEKLQAMEPSPLQRAFDNYTQMEEQLRITIERNRTLQIENANLLSEAGMLRDLLDRADADRIRLQAISSTLLGRLLAINDCIAGAVKASIKDGIEAATKEHPTEDAVVHEPVQIPAPAQQQIAMPPEIQWV